MSPAKSAVSLFLYFSVFSRMFAAPLYTITDLGITPAGARAINNAGNVATNLGNSAAARIGNTTTTLGTFGGSYSTSNGINSSNQVTGGAELPGSVARAFVWSGGALMDLGTLGGLVSSGNDINDSGWVTGDAQTGSGVFSHAFLWKPGSGMQDLGTLGGNYSYGAGINAAGHVVGSSDTAGGLSRAFLWDGASMIDLGSLGSHSYALDINTSGVIAGHSYVGSSVFAAIHAVIWRNGQITDLGTLGGFFSFASAINDAGWVVGRSDLAAGGQVGYVWDGTAMHRLDPLLVNGAGWTILGANDINSAGQIVGSALFGNEVHAVLLTPVSDVPEPSTATLLGAGFLLVRAAMWGSRRGGRS